MATQLVSNKLKEKKEKLKSSLKEKNMLKFNWSAICNIETNQNQHEHASNNPHEVNHYLLTLQSVTASTDCTLSPRENQKGASVSNLIETCYHSGSFCVGK